MIRKKQFKSYIPILAGLLLALATAKLFFNTKKNFADLALGEETKHYQAVDNNVLIHLVNITSRDEAAFMGGWEKRGKKPVILVLGNSQTHSINQMKEGEINYVKILHDSLKRKNFDLLANSIPNANLQEFLVMANYWCSKLPLKVMIIPIFMDDFRETGLRGVFFESLIRNHYRITDSSSDLSRKINIEIAGMESTEAGNTDIKALKATVQENVEKKLNSWLTENSDVWQNRETIRGELFGWLYNLRNTVFNITASSKRKMIPSRYEDNMEALDGIIKMAKSKNIKLVLYIPPIRHDVPIPYDENEYNNFKDKIARYQSPDVLVRNFENIVNGEYWGTKNGTSIGAKKEIDFMHFQFRGHRILADSLNQALKNLSVNDF